MGVCWSKTMKVECTNVHPWTASCLDAAFNNPVALKQALKIYTSLYTISFLLSRKGVQYVRKKLWKEILRSSIFLSSHGCFFCFYMCIFRKVLGTFHLISVGLLPGFASAWTCIIMERKSRRGVLAMYMFNLACETLFSILKGAGYVSDVPYGEVVIFSVATSILMYMYSAGTLPNGFVKTILDKCFNSNSIQENTEDSSTKRTSLSFLTVLKHSMFSGGQVFIASWILHTTYSLVNYLPKLLKNPSRILALIQRKDNASFAAWLGSFVFAYKFIIGSLDKYSCTFGDLANANAALAGGLAGLSILWYPKTSYAVYVAAKTLELAYMRGIEAGVVPYFQHFDSLLYSCCTAVMLHTLILQPHHMKPTYFTFLDMLSGYKFSQVPRAPLDVLGLDSSRVQVDTPNAWLGREALAAHALRPLHFAPVDEE